MTLFRPSRPGTLAGVVLALLALTGCTADDRAGTAGATTASATGSAGTTVATGSAPSASADPSGSDTSSASVQTTLGLDTQGLRLDDGGTDRVVEFGADRATVTGLLTRYLGPVTTDELPECGQGPRTSLAAGELVTLFDGDSFVGWELRGSSEPPLLLPDGLGIGSTLAELQDAYQVSVEETTLGTEFFTRDGQFGGFLDGTGPTATATRLSARETCYFR